MNETKQCALRDAAPDLLAACKGLLGLIKLIAHGQGDSDLLKNHRVEDARRVIAKLERHTHVSSMDGSDTCKACGCDLRDDIHLRIAEAANGGRDNE